MVNILIDFSSTVNIRTSNLNKLQRMLDCEHRSKKNKYQFEKLRGIAILSLKCNISGELNMHRNESNVEAFIVRRVLFRVLTISLAF